MARGNFAPGRVTRGEFHPEPLTDPDVSTRKLRRPETLADISCRRYSGYALVNGARFLIAVLSHPGV